MTMIHSCKENTQYHRARPETQYQCREDKKGQWVLVYGEDLWYPVILNYCPFCGIRLMPPTENNRDN